MNKKLLFITLLAFGIFLRLFVSTQAHTYDADSYEIVAKIALSGRNVYAETERYNYGPVWFILLSVFMKASNFFPHPQVVFRFIIVLFLSLVDLGLWIWIRKRWGALPAFMYFFNPISILVTGFYSQFDGLSLFIALIAVAYLEKAKYTLRDKNTTFGLALMGFSLSIKHVLFAYPLWLVVRSKKIDRHIILFVIPYIVFFLSFVPFLSGGWRGILTNVFQYTSFNNAPFWAIFIPDFIKRTFSPSFIFYGAIVLGAWIYRKTDLKKNLLFYLVILVIFAPALAEQYFIYVLPLISLQFNLFFAFFIIIETLLMLLMMAGGEYTLHPIGLFVDRSGFGFNWQIVFFILGFLYIEFKRRIIRPTGKQIIGILLCINIIFHLFVTLPSYFEDKIVANIQNTIGKGDYERANALFVETQRDPPFAGSRYYAKLVPVKRFIDYYRTFKYAEEIVIKKELPTDWESTMDKLRFIPENFKYKAEVNQILQKHTVSQRE